ncbi:MAG: hypothetical protein HKP30_18440 [Myxococcales bacterium]|nr:hypothetical protein [Myxococcales bacterium]
MSVSVFGTSGDGLDVPSSAADFAALDAVAGFSGSHVFFVDSLGWCGNAPTTTAIGCADTPGCSGNPNDDPFLVAVVTLEAHELYDVLGQTLAHERGHNACLNHVAANGCQIMQSSTGGGCLDASECGHFQDGRTGAGGTCECHLDASNLEPDGAACSEGAISGACSGGLCRALPSEASSQLLVAGGAESLAGATPDDALRMSGATGGYADAGPIGSGAEPRGLAYDPDRGVVFAVTPTAGDDELVTLDAATGAWIGSVGSLVGIQDVIALAFDPGPTSDPADDRLFALDDDASSFEDLLEIDPATAAVVNRGGLNTGLSSGFTGLAFDASTGTLYASSAAGLFTIDPTSCPPGLCNTTPVSGVSVARTGSGLAWSAESGLLHLVGNQFGDARTLYDTIDPVSLTVGETIIIDGFSAGGVAAPPADVPACRNGLDDDGDGEADFPDDVGCYEPDSAVEQPQCQDGVDNDGQPGTDFDGGESILGVGNGDPNGADPQCVGKPFRNKESNASSCGLGAELALLLPILLGARRRRR